MKSKGLITRFFSGHIGRHGLRAGETPAEQPAAEEKNDIGAIRALRVTVNGDHGASGRNIPERFPISLAAMNAENRCCKQN